MDASAAKLVWTFLAMLMVTIISYIGIRRSVATLWDRVYNRNILVIGDERSIQAIDGQMARQVDAPHQIRTKVCIQGADETFSDEIVRLVANERVSEIIVAFRDCIGNGISMSTLLELRMRGVTISDFADFLEYETGRVELDSLRPGWIVYSDGFRTSMNFRILKRTLDVVMSAAMLVICMPIMLLTAVAVRLCDSGPVLYRQTRVGYAGKFFVLYKFRSMSVDAEEPGQPVWAQKNDSRITAVGRLIRATHIDELPQLINVLKGEMSLVGPRPERPEFVSQLKEQIEYYDFRHYMLPGITGWAQINVGYTRDIIGAMRKLSYDLYYMKYASILLDMYILAVTLKMILWREVG